MPQCFESHNHSLKSHPHHLSENNERKSESESEDTPLSYTPPQFLKAKNMYTYSRINKYTVRLSDKKRDPQSKNTERFIINVVEQEHKLVCDGQSNLSEVQTAEDKDLWSADDSEPLQSSIDSNSTTSSFNKGSNEAESTCGFCEDQTGRWKPREKYIGYASIQISNSSERPHAWSFSGCMEKAFSFQPYAAKNTRTAFASTPSRSKQPDPQPISAHITFSRPEPFSPSRRTRALFEDVWVTPESTISKSPSLPGSFVNESQYVSSAGSSSNLSFKSEEENKSSEDETPEQLVPLKRVRKVCSHRRTSKRGRVPTQANPKKKCVNGFIMFCRINRKLCIRSYPGIPSTTVTKELANLWHILPKKERHLYCLKAWSFSRQQNRNVRAQKHEAEMKPEHFVPSPLHILLAYRDKYAALK